MTLSAWVLVVFASHATAVLDMPSKAACEAAKAQVYEVEGSWNHYVCVYRGEPQEAPK
jgi:hypothetical protein